jgi:hypothetical protein
MKPDPSNKTADAIIGKKSVNNADQCPLSGPFLKGRRLKSKARRGPETGS